MRRGLLTLMLCAGLCACDRGQPEDIDAEALTTVEEAVEEELNAPAYAILAVLRGAAQEAQVGWDALFITPADEAEPINWWLQRRGYIELSGAQFATRAAFTLSQAANDLVAQPDQPWFEVAASGEPKIDCETPAAVAAGGCEVELEVTPVLSPAGRAAIGQAAVPLEPLTVSAVLALGAEGEWEVAGLLAQGGSIPDLGLAAILGNAEQRQAAARAANGAMNDRLAQLAGETEPVINMEAYTPPNYIEPDAPVPPLEAPNGRPTTPFRPGQ
jgi:hypothetical protein